MLKLYFVAKDTTKAEARKVASQDDSIVIDLRIVGTAVTAILMISLIVSNISLKRDYKIATLADDATISGLEQNVAEKQDKINSLEKQLKEQKEKVVEATEDVNDSLILENGILDDSLYEYSLDQISFMKFDKPVKELEYEEDRATVNHNVALSSTENSSSGFEWGEEPEEIEGTYLLVEKENEWGYISLDLNVDYNVPYRDFMNWKNAYLVFESAPMFAGLEIGGISIEYGFKEGQHAEEGIKLVGNGGYGVFDLSSSKTYATSQGVTVTLWDVE